MNEEKNIVTNSPEVTPIIEVNQIEEVKEVNNMEEVTCTVIDILTPSERTATNEANEAKEALQAQAQAEAQAQEKAKKEPLTPVQKAEKKALQAQEKAKKAQVQEAKASESLLKAQARKEEARQEIEEREAEALKVRVEEALKKQEKEAREAQEKENFGNKLIALAQVNRNKSKAVNKKEFALQDYFKKYIDTILALQHALYNFGKASHDGEKEEALQALENTCYSLEREVFSFYKGVKLSCKKGDIIHLVTLATKKAKIGKFGYKTTVEESPRTFQGLLESFVLDRKDNRKLRTLEEIELDKAKAKAEQAKEEAEQATKILAK